jgi:hypothetical protein
MALDEYDVDATELLLETYGLSGPLCLDCAHQILDFLMKYIIIGVSHELEQLWSKTH